MALPIHFPVKTERNRWDDIFPGWMYMGIWYEKEFFDGWYFYSVMKLTVQYYIYHRV